VNDERATETPRDAASPGARRPAGEDDPLGAALRALPAERAGAGFTGRMLARLDETSTAGRSGPGRSGSRTLRPARLRPAAWAALAAATLAVALGLALVRGSGPPPGELIASSESELAETPAVTVPTSKDTRQVRGDPGGEGTAASPSAAIPESAASAGSVTPGEVSSAGTTGSALPLAPGGTRRAGSDAAGSPAGDRERTALSARPADAVRLAAADAGAAGSRRRAPDRGATVAPSVDPRSALARVRAELDALRREHRRFEVALAELPEIGRDGQPVVFLGGDEGLGLVLDLGREATAGEVAEAGERRPSL
jgi:hypothetical protein